MYAVHCTLLIVHCTGEKITMRFEVVCGQPIVYEWMKQGIREDITVNPPEVNSGVNSS